MTQSTVLPPTQPRAADIAATSGRDSAAASAQDGDGASFGDVLKAQIGKQTAGIESKSQEPPISGDTGNGQDMAAIIAAGLTDGAVVTSATVRVQVPANTQPIVQGEDDAPHGPLATLPPITAGIDHAKGSVQASVQTRPTDVGKRQRQAVEAAATELPDDPRMVAVNPEIVATHSQMASQVSGDDSDAKIGAATGPAELSGRALPALDTRKEGTALPVKFEVSQPLHAPAWRDSFADRVSWVANARQPSAEMQINPPNLGPVEIRVNMNADQANLSFYSPHAAVREAIQAALPRLQESLSASGLTLGEVFVGADSQSGQQPGNREHGARHSARRTSDFAVGDPPAAVTWLRPGGGLGRVDLFA